MDNNKKLGKIRLRRRRHVRNKLRGTADQPRLCLQRSLKHFACQVIDDSTGKTLLSASTRDKAVRGQVASGGNCDAAAKIGSLIAEKVTSAGIKTRQIGSWSRQVPRSDQSVCRSRPRGRIAVLEHFETETISQVTLASPRGQTH